MHRVIPSKLQGRVNSVGTGSQEKISYPSGRRASSSSMRPSQSNNTRLVSVSNLIHISAPQDGRSTPSIGMGNVNNASYNPPDTFDEPFTTSPFSPEMSKEYRYSVPSRGMMESRGSRATAEDGGDTKVTTYPVFAILDTTVEQSRVRKIAPINEEDTNNKISEFHSRNSLNQPQVVAQGCWLWCSVTSKVSNSKVKPLDVGSKSFILMDVPVKNKGKIRTEKVYPYEEETSLDDPNKVRSSLTKTPEFGSTQAPTILGDTMKSSVAGSWLNDNRGLSPLKLAPSSYFSTQMSDDRTKITNSSMLIPQLNIAPPPEKTLPNSYMNGSYNSLLSDGTVLVPLGPVFLRPLKHLVQAEVNSARRASLVDAEASKVQMENLVSQAFGLPEIRSPNRESVVSPNLEMKIYSIEHVMDGLIVAESAVLVSNE